MAVSAHLSEELGPVNYMYCFLYFILKNQIHENECTFVKWKVCYTPDDKTEESASSNHCVSNCLLPQMWHKMRWSASHLVSLACSVMK